MSLKADTHTSGKRGNSEPGPYQSAPKCRRSHDGQLSIHRVLRNIYLCDRILSLCVQVIPYTLSRVSSTWRMYVKSHMLVDYTREEWWNLLPREKGRITDMFVAPVVDICSSLRTCEVNHLKWMCDEDHINMRWVEDFSVRCLHVRQWYQTAVDNVRSLYTEACSQSIEVAKFGMSHGLPIYTDAAVYAIKGNRLRELKWLLKHMKSKDVKQVKMHSGTHSGHSGNMKMVMWVQRNLAYFDGSVVQGAVRAGHGRRFVEELLSVGCPCPSTIVNDAIESGIVETAEFLFTLYGGLDEEMAYKLAVTSTLNQVPMVDWLASIGIPLTSKGSRKIFREGWDNTTEFGNCSGVARLIQIAPRLSNHNQSVVDTLNDVMCDAWVWSVKNIEPDFMMAFFHEYVDVSKKTVTKALSNWPVSIVPEESTNDLNNMLFACAKSVAVLEFLARNGFYASARHLLVLCVDDLDTYSDWYYKGTYRLDEIYENWVNGCLEDTYVFWSVSESRDFLTWHAENKGVSVKIRNLARFILKEGAYVPDRRYTDQSKILYIMSLYA